MTADLCELLLLFARESCPFLEYRIIGFRFWMDLHLAFPKGS